jgi:hypothetical protein
LQEALSQIKLTPVTIPAIHQLLIPSANLEFPTNIAQTGIAQSSFVLNNPFTASINILELTATATYNGLTLGKINHVDMSSNPITAGGHQNITSPSVPLNFNLDPVTIVALIADAANGNNVDLGPLAQLFQIVISNPNFQSPINSSVGTGPAVCVGGQQFDVDAAILNALKGLKVDLAIESGLKLDEYATDLTFTQSGVTVVTDNTALYLIGAVAPPIVQNLVDGAELKFTQANITNLSEGGFDLALVGSLTNIGPLDAKISFPEPVVISWQGNDIATITLPPVCAAANTGVPNYAPKATLQITDLDQFVVSVLCHNVPTIHTILSGLRTSPPTFCTARHSHGPFPRINSKSKLLALFSTTCRLRRTFLSQHSMVCQVSRSVILCFRQMIPREVSTSRLMPSFRHPPVCCIYLLCFIYHVF